MQDPLKDIDPFLSLWETFHVVSAIAILVFLIFFIKEGIEDKP